MTTLRSIVQSLTQSKPGQHTADFFSGPVLAGHHVVFHLNLHFKTGHETHYLSLVKKGDSDITVWKDPYPYRRESQFGDHYPGVYGYNAGFTVDEPGEYEAVVTRLGRVQSRFPFTAVTADASIHASIRLEDDEGVSFFTFSEMSALLGKGHEYAVEFANTVTSMHGHTVRKGLYDPTSGTYYCINRSLLNEQMQAACQ